MRAQYRRKLIDSVESVVGDLVNDIIDRYYGDRVESEYDYEKILYYIARHIKQEVFSNKASFDEVVEYLSKLRTKGSLAKLVLSYMISKALEEPD